MVLIPIWEKNLLYNKIWQTIGHYQLVTGAM
jgi:hypothetical protein